MQSHSKVAAVTAVIAKIWMKVNCIARALNWKCENDVCRLSSGVSRTAVDAIIQQYVESGYRSLIVSAATWEGGIGTRSSALKRITRSSVLFVEGISKTRL